MAKVTITNPAPSAFRMNRRKCGWGSVSTTCDICGKIMVGHNRGVCSKCMRSSGLRGDTIFTPRAVGIRHLLTGDTSVKRAQAQTLRELYANGGMK